METQPIDQEILKSTDATSPSRIDEAEPVKEQSEDVTTAMDIITKKIGQIKIEYCSHQDKTEQIELPYTSHGFISTLHTAYTSDLKLKLSADDFFILIEQGLSKHGANNSNSEVTKCFVKPKKNVSVRRDEFVFGGENDWSSIVDEVTLKMNKPKHEKESKDETSKPAEAIQIESQSTLTENEEKHLFIEINVPGYISGVVLKGEPEEWELLRKKTQDLVELNKEEFLELGWWLKHLLPVVEKICDAGSKREIDIEFWSRIYEHKSNIGCSSIYGWISVFFPYLCINNESSSEMIQNSFDGTGIVPEMFPADEIYEFPFTLEIKKEKIPMKIYSGFLGAKSNEEKQTTKADVFWCIAKSEEEKIGFWNKLSSIFIIC